VQKKNKVQKKKKKMKNYLQAGLSDWNYSSSISIKRNRQTAVTTSEIEMSIGRLKR